MIARDVRSADIRWRFFYWESEVSVMFNEKNGLIVLVIGKRIIVYDQEANVIDKEKLHNYAWEVKNG